MEKGWPTFSKKGRKAEWTPCVKKCSGAQEKREKTDDKRKRWKMGKICDETFGEKVCLQESLKDPLEF